jgi:type I restriction enzyme, S subunit
VKPGWTHATLEELVQPVAKAQPKSKFRETNFTYIDLSAIDRDLKQISGAVVVPATDAPSRARQLLRQGDVLVSTVRPNLNAVAIVGPALDGAIGSTGFTVLRPKSRLDHRYLFHWVKSQAFVRSMVQQATGASYPAVSDRIVKAAQIPLPPLSEQQLIAHSLDDADLLMVKRRASLGLLAEMIDGIFAALVSNPEHSSWPTLALPDAYWFQEGPGVRTTQFTTDGVKLLNVRNIERYGILNLSTTDRHISRDEAEGRYRHFLVDTGDLVVASSGITFAGDGLLRTRAAFVSGRDRPLCMNTSTIRFKSRDGISDLRFLASWLDGYEFRSQITQRVTGSAQQNFGPTHLRNVTITLPPLDLQRSFAHSVEMISSLRGIQQASMQNLAELCMTLQQRAFSGEL